MNRDFENEKLESKRKYLSELLNKLTEKQMILFVKCFGEKVTDDRLDSAISLCERTIF